MANRVDIVDLSHHNTVTDWGAIQRAGVIGVILKATEGSTFTDSTFKDRRDDAANAGLIVSSYHFLRHGDVDAQIAHYFDVVMPQKGERVCIDFEQSGSNTPPTLDDLHAAIDAILTRDPTLQIAIYCGHLLKELLGDRRDEKLAQHALWLAQYTAGTPSWPKGTWPIWTLWQYSDGTAGGQPRLTDGVKGPVDCNVFNGSRENAAIWLAPVDDESDDGGEVEPIPPDEVGDFSMAMGMRDGVVVATIITPPGMTVSIEVNGKIVAGGRFD
jgi:lysozyme